MALFNQITIIGLGLIGSSLARNIREKELARRVIGCDTEEVIGKAKAMGIIHAGGSNPADTVKRSEMVILCVPPSEYSEIVSAMAPSLKMDAIITDVGSVKQAVIESVQPHLRAQQLFIPAHPIAGSEKSGIEAGDINLFHQKKVIITPISGASHKKAEEKIALLWQSCGASIEKMSAEAHDRVYASMSHAPQMLAYAYVVATSYHREILAAQKDQALIDFIRLAGSKPALWRDIVAANDAFITAALEKFAREFDQLVNLWKDGEHEELIKQIHREGRHFSKWNKTVAAELPKRSYSANNYYFAAAVLLPSLIACAASMAFTDTDYAGSGFASVLSPLLYSDRITEARLADPEQQEKITNTLIAFPDTLKIIKGPLPDDFPSRSQDLFSLAAVDHFIINNTTGKVTDMDKQVKAAFEEMVLSNYPKATPSS